MDSTRRTPRQIRLDLSPRHQLAGFNFTHHMRQLCDQLVTTLPELAHIRLDQVAIGYSQARKAVSHGLQATLTPMRFEAGSLFTTRHGRRYRVQQFVNTAGDEVLYILTFYLPRLLDQPFSEKLITVLHELWHISPDFNGDIRRHPGRCYAHTKSEREYDRAMARLAQRWLAGNPPRESYEFLNHRFRDLCRRHGSVYGHKIRSPKLIPVVSTESAE
jgi:hypothetical protein